MTDAIKKPIPRPEFVTEAHLTYLDSLRESGDTNMFAARPYLVRKFHLEPEVAAKVLTYWMRSFGERHPKAVE